MKTSTMIAGVVGIGVLAALLLILGPFLTIWAWNELFGSLHYIEFTFWTWCAVIILGGFFRADFSNKKAKD
jgi:hypothetical protein